MRTALKAAQLLTALHEYRKKWSMFTLEKIRLKEDLLDIPVAFMYLEEAFRKHL